MSIVDVDAWQGRRLAYWRSLIGVVDSDTLPLFDDVSALRAADEIVAWLGTSLDSQLTLPWLVALLRALDVDPGRLAVIQFHRNERNQEITGLGMLNPQQLAAHPGPVRLSPSDIGELTRVWDALTAPEPDLCSKARRASSTRTESTIGSAGST